MFSTPRQQAAVGNQCKGQEDTADHVLPSCCFCFFFFFFFWTGVHVLSRLFLPPRGPWSAHKRHCLQGLLTACQESLWSTGSTLTALPRRPIHPHRLGSTHTLSVSQRHSQWHSKGSSGLSDELDQIPTSHLVTRRFFNVLPLGIIYALLMVSIISPQWMFST